MTISLFDYLNFRFNSGRGIKGSQITLDSTLESDSTTEELGISESFKEQEREGFSSRYHTGGFRYDRVYFSNDFFGDEVELAGVEYWPSAAGIEVVSTEHPPRTAIPISSGGTPHILPGIAANETIRDFARHGDFGYVLTDQGLKLYVANTITGWTRRVGLDVTGTDMYLVAAPNDDSDNIYVLTRGTGSTFTVSNYSVNQTTGELTLGDQTSFDHDDVDAATPEGIENFANNSRVKGMSAYGDQVFLYIQFTDQIYIMALDNGDTVNVEAGHLSGRLSDIAGATRTGDLEIVASRYLVHLFNHAISDGYGNYRNLDDMSGSLYDPNDPLGLSDAVHSGLLLRPDSTTGRLPTASADNAGRLGFDGHLRTVTAYTISAGTAKSVSYSAYSDTNYRGIHLQDSEVSSPSNGNFYLNYQYGSWRRYDGTRWSPWVGPSGWIPHFFLNETEAEEAITANGQIFYFPSRVYQVTSFTAAVGPVYGYHWVLVDDGITRFVDDQDTPSDYSGHGGDLVGVKLDESGLDFVDSRYTPSVLRIGYVPELLIDDNPIVYLPHAHTQGVKSDITVTPDESGEDADAYIYGWTNQFITEVGEVSALPGFINWIATSGTGDGTPYTPESIASYSEHGMDALDAVDIDGVVYSLSNIYHRGGTFFKDILNAAEIPGNQATFTFNARFSDGNWIVTDGTTVYREAGMYQWTGSSYERLGDLIYPEPDTGFLRAPTKDDFDSRNGNSRTIGLDSNGLNRVRRRLASSHTASATFNPIAENAFFIAGTNFYTWRLSHHSDFQVSSPSRNNFYYNTNSYLFRYYDGSIFRDLPASHPLFRAMHYVGQYDTQEDALANVTSDLDTVAYKTDSGYQLFNVDNFVAGADSDYLYEWERIIGTDSFRSDALTSDADIDNPHDKLPLALYTDSNQREIRRVVKSVGTLLNMEVGISGDKVGWHRLGDAGSVTPYGDIIEIANEDSSDAQGLVSLHHDSSTNKLVLEIGTSESGPLQSESGDIRLEYQNPETDVAFTSATLSPVTSPGSITFSHDMTGRPWSVGDRIEFRIILSSDDTAEWNISRMIRVVDGDMLEDAVAPFLPVSSRVINFSDDNWHDTGVAYEDGRILFITPIAISGTYNTFYEPAMFNVHNARATNSGTIGAGRGTDDFVTVIANQLFIGRSSDTDASFIVSRGGTTVIGVYVYAF